MKPDSERAERAMRAAARCESVPADLSTHIMQAVSRDRDRGRHTRFHHVSSVWSLALAASLLAALGLWWTLSISAPPPTVAPSQPVAASSSISDLNPAHLVSAAMVDRELQQVRADLSRAFTYVLTPAHPPAAAL